MSKRAATSEEPSLPLAMRLAKNGILSAAASVFTKKGAVATRVEDLLKAADVARRTFYKYFDSKEDVLAALYEVATGELAQSVATSSAEAKDPLDGLHRGIDVYLDYHAANAGLIKILIEHAIPSESPLAPMRRRFRDQMVQLMMGAAARAGEKVDALTCTALLAALEGTSLYLVEKGSAPTGAEIAHAKRVMHTMLDRVVLGGEKKR